MFNVGVMSQTNLVMAFVTVVYLAQPGMDLSVLLLVSGVTGVIGLCQAVIKLITAWIEWRRLYK